MAVCLATVFPIMWYWTVSSVSIVTCGGLSGGSVPDPVVLDSLFSQHCDLWRSVWRQCSRSCGIGVQRRRPSCHRLNMFGWLDPEPAPDALCSARRQPETVRKCHRSCSTRHRWKAGDWSQVGTLSPRSPLSGCLYRDVIWGTESLTPIQIQWNMAELNGGLAP